MEQLKLAALDKQDLDVLSAHLQDSVLMVGDLQYLPGESRFLVTLNRFAWEKGGADAKSKERRRTILGASATLSTTNWRGAMRSRWPLPRWPPRPTR